ncbi:hypothetical protein TTHERM_001131811 (macronuclear) [Tetrahymena thermophila SB210]|uniref:Uncharacterized protein n=1 Tax=Tetrahymena thermophila (strain SB210) TaxID=312017 RepID=W7XBG9_TETTS|nr:hypothetical protein TTHERM_001131811 [Tetrahymena thermophila SB210]EWS71021.1 hypothetical protein TTHERM_001131811 [Tetrahymena thermophila SB210]|eukprot:XP_012656442.1 hypothetical protein TTHERM_001131811 [Tetrahymena thermophila SB210]
MLIFILLEVNSNSIYQLLSSNTLLKQMTSYLFMEELLIKPRKLKVQYKLQIFIIQIILQFKQCCHLHFSTIQNPIMRPVKVLILLNHMILDAEIGLYMLKITKVFLFMSHTLMQQQEIFQ